ncbi:MAG: single-stranded DNA-binding protein [Gemmatimonadota bacterium]
MMNEAHVFFSGYVATDPVYWQNQDGNAKAQLRVAYTPRHVDRSTGEWTDNPTSFVTVVCWRKLADNVAMCVHKGDPVVVRGRMQVRQYDDRAGNPRLSVDVDASAIGHDLAKGVALFQRTRRPAGDAAAAPAPGTADLAGGAGDGVSDDVLDDRMVAALTASGDAPNGEADGASAGDEAPVPM